MKILFITNSIKQSRDYILQQIQQAWDFEVQNDNRKNKMQYLKESDFFKIIDSKNKFDNFDFKFIPDVIFILPELMWEQKDVNEGYDLIRGLISQKYKSDLIQIVFLSVLEKKEILKHLDTRNKNFVEAFPHVCLLDHQIQLKFDYYSEIHYKLIKHLAISDQGRLQKIGHELNSVKANIQKNTKDVELNKKDLQIKLEELMLFQQWTEIEIPALLKKLNEINSNEKLNSFTKNVEDTIDKIGMILPKLDNNIFQKYNENYKIFVIDDEKQYRSHFYDVLSKYYKHVYPNKVDKYLAGQTLKDFSIYDIEQIIKKNCKDYQIFLIDLLYKDENGWLNFNGLDLYILIKKINPHAVIRIITSLPRSIVAKLVEVIMNNTEKPNTDQVFTKKYGFDALKDLIIENIDKMNEECKKNEKSKSVWAPFPKEGVFKWGGVQNFIYQQLFEETNSFNEKVSKAKVLFDLYLNGNLEKNTIN